VSYNPPAVVLDRMTDAAEAKLAQSVASMLLRSSLAAGILSLAVCLAVTVAVQTQLKIAGAVIFPVGFVLLILLGLDLVTGNFAVVPLPILRGRPRSLPSVLRNWGWIFLGNLLGSLATACFVATSMTMGFSGAQPPETASIVAIAEAKTKLYEAAGASGMLAVFVRAILCNWMVTLGVVMAFSSQSAIGKIAGMWLPIMLFFGLGYEHSVVNMFVIPLGMLLGAPVTVSEWWLWNQVPVTLGNMVGGFVLTGWALHAAHAPPKPALEPVIE